MRKKIYLSILFFCFITAVLPVYAAGKPEIKEIKLATAFKTGGILTDYCDKFKELVEKRTKGNVIVTIEAGADTEENVNIRCSKGEVDMEIAGGQALQVFAPQYFFFNGPYVIKDYAHFVRVWNGKLGKQAQETILKNGNMLCAGTVYRGFRQMTSNKAINGPADLTGLKLRLPTVPAWVAVWKVLETEPVTIPLTGLYAALANGTAEASEGDLPQVDSFKLYEVQTHLSITNHLVAVGWVTFNSTAFKRFDKKTRQLILEASNEACTFITEKAVAGEQSVLAALKAKNMIVVAPDADAIRLKARPAVEQLFQTEWPVTTWDEVLAQ